MKTNFAVAACITATIKNQRFVLLVRKGNNFDEAQGYYLFPGGFYDHHRDQGDFSAAARRETREESGVDASQATCTPLALYEAEVAEVHIKRHFFQFDLGKLDRLPYCTPDSDIAEARWANLQEIEQLDYQNELGMRFKTIPIGRSNALILQAVIANTAVNSQQIIANEADTHEKSPHNIASALFYTFHLQSAYSVRNQLMDTFLLLKTQIPEGYLAHCYDEILYGLQQDKGEDYIKVLVEDFISHLIKTGHCNIDDLLQNGKTLLTLACTSNATSAITSLLNQGANVNCLHRTFFETQTSLSRCLIHNFLDTARLLIENHGAKLNLGGATNSALTLACSLPGIPEAFIEYIFTRVEVMTDDEVGTLVHALIKSQRHSLLDKFLGQYPIDLNRSYLPRLNMGTKTYAMLTAIQAYDLECVKILLKHGADPTLQHQTGSSFIDFTLFMQRELVFKESAVMAQMPSHRPGFVLLNHSFSHTKAMSEAELQQELVSIKDKKVKLDAILSLLKSLNPATAWDLETEVELEILRSYSGM